MTRIRTLWAGLLAVLVLLSGSAAAQEYRIQPGDVLRIEVIEDPDLNRSVLVSPDGRISVPLAGTVRAGGRTVEQVQASLTSQLSPAFAATPNVFVAIQSLAERREVAPAPPPVVEIFVIGEAGNKGKLGLEPGTTLLQAFAQMGGFSNFAATSRIQLRRTNPQTGREEIFLIDYDAIVAGQSPNGSVQVADGDVIIVPQRTLFE